MLGIAVLDKAAAVGIDHIEGIETDIVGAVDPVRAHDVSARQGKGARQFVKKTGTVPGDDVDDGGILLAIILPVNDWDEGT